MPYHYFISDFEADAMLLSVTVILSFHMLSHLANGMRLIPSI